MAAEASPRATAVVSPFRRPTKPDKPHAALFICKTTPPKIPRILTVHRSLYIGGENATDEMCIAFIQVETRNPADRLTVLMSLANQLDLMRYRKEQSGASLPLNTFPNSHRFSVQGP